MEKEYVLSTAKNRKIFFVDGSEKGTAYSFLALYGDEWVNAKDIEQCPQKEFSILVFNSQNLWINGIAELRFDDTLPTLIISVGNR